MNYSNDTNFIENSNSYKRITNLMEDFESTNKLLRKRIKEEDPRAAIRCSMLMEVILYDLKGYLLK